MYGPAHADLLTIDAVHVSIVAAMGIGHRCQLEHRPVMQQQLADATQ